jgi:hypothetical protein
VVKKSPHCNGRDGRGADSTGFSGRDNGAEDGREDSVTGVLGVCRRDALPSKVRSHFWWDISPHKFPLNITSRNGGGLVLPKIRN